MCLGANDMISWKNQLKQYLQVVLTIMCERYRGDGYEKVQQALRFGHVFQAYFIMTQNTKTAVITKKIIFLDPHVLINCAVNRKWTTAERMLRSPRTEQWLAAFRKSASWWSGNLTKATEQIERLDERTFLESYSIDKYVDSYDPKEIGTYSHAKHCDLLTEQAASMLGMKDLHCFVPGRMVHSSLAFFGATPDGIAVKNMQSFYILLNDVMEGKTVTSKKVAKNGRVRLTLELKTITSESSSVNYLELNDIIKGSLHFGIEWGKDKAVELLRQKLIKASWIPDKLTNSLSDTETLKMFTHHKTRLFPATEYNRIKYRPVAASRYPNYVPWFNKIKDTCEENMRAIKCNVDKHSSTIKPVRIANPGKARILVFDVKNESNKPIMCFDYDVAPFIIAYHSQHNNQIMLQHIIANSYAKKPCKSVYCVGLHASRRENGTGSHAVRLAMVYMYDIGITTHAAIEFSERICTEMALAESNRDEGSVQLVQHLMDSCKDMRVANLYNTHETH